eukprot:gene26326-biopygen15833
MLGGSVGVGKSCGASHLGPPVANDARYRRVRCAHSLSLPPLTLQGPPHFKW